MSQTWKKIALYTCGAISGVALSIGAQSFAADKKTDDNLPIPIAQNHGGSVWAN